MDAKNLTDEQRERARNITSAEDLIKFAEEEGLELTDEQLESVSGGWNTCGTYDDCNQILYPFGNK